MIKEDPANQTSVGPLIANEAEALRDAGALDAARDLLASAAKMNPPLGSTYQSRLKEVEQFVQQKLRGENQPGAPSGVLPGPQNAAAPAATTTPTASGR